MSRLSLAYYRSNDVVGVARDLIGKVLVSDFNGGYTSGIITETEAYHQCEKACHAFNGRRTPRTQILFERGGCSYVYLCYGMHYLFNITTGSNEEASAVLIRALKPLNGLTTMMQRRSINKSTPRLTSGPGNLTRAMGIDLSHNALKLTKQQGIWVESYDNITDQQIGTSQRVGVEYAEEDALLPWRFFLTDCKWVSKL